MTLINVDCSVLHRKLTCELTRCRTALSEKDVKLANLNEELNNVKRQLETSSVEVIEMCVCWCVVFVVTE